MRHHTILFISFLPISPCYAQTGSGYAIDSCPDTTRACVFEYTSLDGTYAGGLAAYSYFDSFGRPEETVSPGLAPDGGDIATLYEHDAFGRQVRQWLPAKGPQSDGRRASPDTLKARSRASNSDSMPFTALEYEPSPQSRPLRSTGPGTAWHSACRAASTRYLSNSLTADSLVCRKFTATQTGATGLAVSCTGTCPAGTLSVIRSEDEDGRATFEFRDRQGRTVLSRRRDADGSGFLDTYFIYSGLGQLMCVLPPLAVPSGTGAVSPSALGAYAYQYTYDSRRRMVGRKLPGAGWTEYVYDNDGRLVFTQDGNQRQAGQWAFCLQDAFGREAVTGTIQGSHPDVSSSSVHVIADLQSATGYAMPSPFQGCTVHTISYYDSYGFLGLLPSGVSDSLAYSAAAGYSVAGPTAVGRLTGRMVYHLDDSGTCETHAFYYDSRNRLIQSHSTNHIGGYEHDFYKLSYTGNEEKHRHVHSAQDQPVLSEVNDCTYDHAGRPLTMTHTLNGGTPVVLASREYDGLGRLKSNTPMGSVSLKMQYTYNVRSWVKTLSSPLYSETLHYEDGGVPCWGGNISAMVWNADTVSRRYDFTYDGLSRLAQADYQESGGQNTGRFSTSYSYDSHGNLTGVFRHGYVNSLPSLQGGGLTYFYNDLDDLTCTYDGNQLVSVANSCQTGQHYNFLDGYDSDMEYTYDSNGNLTSDLNKGLNLVTYNALNLPDSMSFNFGNSIRYLYGADGVKLRVRYRTAQSGGIVPFAHSGGQVQASGLPGIDPPLPPVTTVTTMDYCGSAIYENNVLTALLVDGGYVSFTKTGTGASAVYTPTYHFYMRDHLGSNRVVASAAGTAEQVSHYYPYGSTFYGESASDHRFKYCGKELDKMHGLDWYDSSARYYDHVLGRFHQIDPLCEKYYSWSPYAYCGGNPVNRIDPYGRKFKWIESQYSNEIYDQVQALRQESEVFNVLYTYLDDLKETYYIYVDDRDVQTSIKKQSRNSNTEAGGYFQNPNKIMFSEKKADTETFTEELFHAFQYRYYKNARKTQELDAEAEILTNIVKLETESESKNIEGILQTIESQGGLPTIFYFFYKQENLAIPHNSYIERRYFNEYLVDFYNKHNRRGDVYRGKLRRLPPNAYNFIINKAFKRFNNE